MDFMVLTNLDTVTRPPVTGEDVTQTTGTSNPAPTQGTAPAPYMTILSLVLYMGFFAVLIWFLIVRPQKKREKSLRELVTNIRTGDSVVTNTGFYGKVVDITEGCFIVEFGTNKGIRIPVEKTEIAGVKEPNLTTKKYDTPAITEDEKK